MANQFQKYYSDLYNLKHDPNTPQPTDYSINTFLNSVTLPKLSEAALNSLNSPIQEKEILDTIKSLPAHKSPGNDGFSAEYYQTFTTILSPHLKNLFNYAASTASFPEEIKGKRLKNAP